MQTGTASTTTPDRAGLALILLIGVSTAAGLVAGAGSVITTLLPILLVSFIYLLWKIPLKWSATSLAFLLLALEVRTDAGGVWASPLLPLGELLYFGLGDFLRVNVAGFELLVLLLLSMFVAKSRGPALGPRVPAPSATRDVLVVYLAGVVFSVVISLSNGFGLVPWKARYLLHGPAFYLLFQAAYREPADFRALGAAVMAAAHAKALLAAWVQLVAAPALTGGRLQYATNHGDSILFALALVIVVIPALEAPSRKRVGRAILLSLIPAWGIVLNDRRTAWAMLAMSAMAIFLISPWRPWKRKLVRAVLIGAPILAAYTWIGWTHASSGLFTPVAKIRSMLDSQDPSTYWRDVETWNIAKTMSDSSILGVGLGGEYIEHMFNDNIADGYADYRGWPHNTILGLLLYMGPFAFISVWLLYLLVVFLAVRGYRHASTSDERSAALICVAAIVCCTAMAWGDTGAHFKQYNIALGAALALAGQLAVSTGGWRMNRSRAVA